MIRNVLTAILLITAGQAQAAWDCSVQPQDDVVIKKQSVQVEGVRGKLILSPQGDIIFNGKQKEPDAATRQQAIEYQQALRRDIPWAEQGAVQRLERGRAALDQVIVNQLGSKSKVRSRLALLDIQLKKQINRIIEHQSDAMIFHHTAVDQVRIEGEQLVQGALGGVVQESLNEMSSRQVGSGDNPLQGIVASMGKLQQAMQAEWRKQEQDLHNFSSEACQRVVNLEAQRQNLQQKMP